MTDVLWIDFGCVLICGVLVLTRPDARHSQPFLLYLLFHVLIFSTRSWGLLVGGGEPLFILRSTDFSRALLLADVVLVAGAFACLVPAKHAGTPNVRLLRPSIVNGVALVALPVGLYFLAVRSAAALQGVRNADYATSYQLFAVTWPGLILLCWIYIYGFRWYFLVPMLAYLVLMGLQGENRFRVLLPAIFLMQIYMDRRGRRLPTAKAVAGLVGLALVFIPLDAIGSAYASGDLTPETLRVAVSESADDLISGDTTDQQVFDQYAAGLVASDELDSPQLGRHFLDLLALPVPRPWWPEKPANNEHLIAVSTESLPLSEIGAVFTFPGELYTDWRWPGLTLGAFVVFLGLIRFYRRAYKAGYGTLAHFAYLVLASLLLQVYRDGLASLMVFVLVQSAPIFVIVLLHLIGARARGADVVVVPAKAIT